MSIAGRMANNRKLQSEKVVGRSDFVQIENHESILLLAPGADCTRDTHTLSQHLNTKVIHRKAA